MIWRWHYQTGPLFHETCRQGLLGTVFGDDTRARRVGVASGCAWIWNEQSDGAGEARGSLGAQREQRSGERGRTRKHSGWEACRWLITTHICSPHFLLYILSLKCAHCLNFNSLPAPVYRLLSLIFKLRLQREVLSWCSFSWRRLSRKR